MPTDNPKISLYVPQQIYDRFKSFQEERKLSMSQAGIVILAEYFGIEETIKEITEGTTVGGVSLSEFEELKERVEQLEGLVKQNKITSELPNQAKEKMAVKPQLELLSEPPINNNPLAIGIDLLSKRLGFDSTRQVSKNRQRYKNTVEKFYAWSQKKDPDYVGWIPNFDSADFEPQDELSNELLDKLQNWIQENS